MNTVPYSSCRQDVAGRGFTFHSQCHSMAERRDGHLSLSAIQWRNGVTGTFPFQDSACGAVLVKGASLSAGRGLYASACIGPENRAWNFVVVLLFSLCLVRLAFHAIYLPLYEGPDEPFHLARAIAFAEGPVSAAWAGQSIPAGLVHSVSTWPCCPDLSRVFGCPHFGDEKTAFNSLTPSAAPSQGGSNLSIENYEAHQPPGYYTLAGVWVRLAHALGPRTFRTPEASLLLTRVFSVALVCFALWGPLRGVFFRGPPGLSVGLLLVLLLPGAAESLARCANESAVFLWSAVLVWAVCRRRGTTTLAGLCAVGPLLKLTALPVAAFAVAWLWRERGALRAAAVASSALLFLPVQAARGWGWGGTVELNSGATFTHQTALSIAAGLLRSTYTFLKTSVWLGEWSFFRPPNWWLALLVATGAWLVLSVRLRPDRERSWAHVTAGAAAAAGFVLFAVANRRLFGTWGGVGGWYIWGWFPWLALAAGDVLQPRRGFGRPALALLAAFVILTNVLWFAAAGRIYGWP